MAEVGRYVVVDPATHTILGGPYMWDGEAQWAPPEGGGDDASDMLADGRLMVESDAVAQGYHYPPPPDQSWVLVDPDTMTVVAGPVSWNGEGDPPLTATGDQQLITESDATNQGYSYPTE